MLIVDIMIKMHASQSYVTSSADDVSCTAAYEGSAGELIAVSAANGFSAESY